MPTMAQSKQHVLVCGAAVFGSSTALSLLETGKYTVTLIDRASSLPAQDAASSDINKIVRYDYGDPDYARLAKEAILDFQQPKWSGVFHQSGVLVLGKPSTGSDYAGSLQNSSQLAGKSLPVFQSPQDYATWSRSTDTIQWSDQYQGYFNDECGWAEATESVKLVLDWVRKAGGEIIPDQTVIDIVKSGDKVTGVKTSQGRIFEADIIVFALGGWTLSCLREPLNLPTDLMHATGQCIAIYQLNEQQAKRHSKEPVMLNKHSNFYMFPCNKDDLLKCVYHKTGPHGYSNPRDGDKVSVPQTVLDEHGRDGAIPAQDLAEITQSLVDHYPDLAGIKAVETRLCWYNDMADHNFLIDCHPEHDNIVFATGGSGHGYKFLPNLGKYVVQRIENTLEPGLADKWAFKDRGQPNLEPGLAVKTKTLHESFHQQPIGQ